LRPRRDGIPESDIDLQGNAGITETSLDPQPNPLILIVLLNLFRLNGVGLKCQTIVVDV
jgi:hypothetical protein